MKKFLTILLGAFTGMLNAITLPAYGTPGSGNSPVTFLQNKGQWPDNILYQATSVPLNVYFMSDGLSFAQLGEEEDSTGQDVYSYIVWNMNFLNTNSDMIINGDSVWESKISYLKGSDSANWVIHPPEYSFLHYNNIYNAIDLDFYGNGNNLKYDYVIHPGGDITSITNNFEGVQQLSVNTNGELEIITSWETQIQKAPVAWQVINGVKYPVEVHYVILNDTTFGFSAASTYNHNYDLVIDPLFEFVFSSYTKALGASNNINYCFSNATDAAGNIYLTGMVDGTYPTTPGAYSGPGAVDPEIFVSKFSKDGTTLIYSTYISGSSREMGLGIAVDAAGRAYIVGYGETNWTGSNTYPTTASAYQPNIYTSSGSDALLTVLNVGGTGLVYSTWFGGDGGEEAYAIVLDGTGKAYITGNTSSGGNTFPTKGTSTAVQQTAQGYHDIFVAKFDISQSGANSLVYSIRLGGGGDDYGRSIAVNSTGNAYVTGRFQDISSPAFPTTPGAYNNIYDGGWDNSMIFITKLSATTPVTYNYSTYLGSGWGNGIAVNSVTGEAYIAGSTSTFTFPTTPGVLQPIHGQDALGNHNADAFVTKLNTSGSNLIYSTFLGGDSGDGGTGITVNSMGEAYVTGVASPGFPTSPGALQPNHATGGGDVDFFVVQLNADATGYGCGGSTFVGGSDSDYGTPMYDYPSPKISLRDHGGVNDTITVSGTSHSTDFPTTPGSYCTTKLNGIADQPVFFNLTCAVATPLPIELISFTGSNEGNRNLLKWATGSETNNDYFAIERSGNKNQFKTIGTVKGAGNSTQIVSYSFSDNNPFSGINYYRLKQVDYNNEFSYSQVISVRNNLADSHCFVYTGETAGNFMLSCNLSGNARAQILNMDGSILKVIKPTGNSANKIDLHEFSNGLYVLKIIDGENIRNYKLIKN